MNHIAEAIAAIERAGMVLDSEFSHASRAERHAFAQTDYARAEALAQIAQAEALDRIAAALEERNNRDNIEITGTPAVVEVCREVR